LTSRALPAVHADNASLARLAVHARFAVVHVLAVVAVRSTVTGLAVNAIDAWFAWDASLSSASLDTGLTDASLGTLGLRRDRAVAFAGLAVVRNDDVLKVLHDARFLDHLTSGTQVGDFAAVAKAVHRHSPRVGHQRHQLVFLEDGEVAYGICDFQQGAGSTRGLLAHEGGAGRAESGQELKEFEHHGAQL